MADRLLVETLSRFGLASVMARDGASDEALAAAIGAPLPDGPRWIEKGGLNLLGIGPRCWLVRADEAGPGWCERLRASLHGLASVSDQSDGYRICRLSGTEARALLQRGAAIDLHPDAFAPGSVATTVIAHIGVIIRQIDATPSYEVALFRSYAGSFQAWLDATVPFLKPLTPQPRVS